MNPIASFAPRTMRADTRHPQYQEIKSRVHADLLNRLNLDRLNTVRREDAEPVTGEEVREGEEAAGGGRAGGARAVV